MPLSTAIQGVGLDFAKGTISLVNRTGETVNPGEVVQVDLTQSSASTTSSAEGADASFLAGAITPTYVTTPNAFYAIVMQTAESGRRFMALVHGKVNAKVFSTLAVSSGDGSLLIIPGSRVLRIDGNGNSSIDHHAGFNQNPTTNAGEQTVSVFFDGMYAPRFANRSAQYRSVRSISKNFGAATVSALGLVVTAEDGTATSSDNNASMPTIQYATNGSGTGVGGINAFANSVQPRWEPEFRFSGRVGATITSVRYWIGLSSALLDAVDTPTTEIVAAFRYDTGADGTAFWRCVTASGSAVTTTTTTVGVAANDFVRMRIAFAGSGTVVRFFINEALVAQHTTLESNVPATSASLGPIARVTELSASSRSIRVGKIEIVAP